MPSCALRYPDQARQQGARPQKHAYLVRDAMTDRDALIMRRGRLVTSPGVVLAAGVSAASLAPILIRYAREADALAISFWRCIIGSAVLMPFCLRGLRRISRVQIQRCGLAGAFLAVHFATWISSLELTTVAASVLLVSTTPIFVALFAPWLLRERMNALGWLGIALTLGGTAAIAGLDVGRSSVAGNLLALCGGAAAAGYVLIGRVARREVPILPYAVVTYAVAAVLLLPLCLTSDVSFGPYPAGTTWALVALVVGPQILGHTVINAVLSSIDATTVAVSFMSEPVAATALAALLFDEIPPPAFYPGAVAILFGIFLVSTNQRPVGPAAPA